MTHIRRHTHTRTHTHTHTPHTHTHTHTPTHTPTHTHPHTHTHTLTHSLTHSPFFLALFGHVALQEDPRIKAVNSARMRTATRFAGAVLEGWERSNPPPQTGDRVGPGKGYRGAPLPSGTSGIVTGPAPGRPGCWVVEWTTTAARDDAGGKTGMSPPPPPPARPDSGTYCYGNGTYELAVLTSVPGLPWVDVVERVPAVEWTDNPSEPFAELAAAADTPLIFRGTAARHWRAHETWQDLDSLLANVSTLEGVKVTRSTVSGDTVVTHACTSHFTVFSFHTHQLCKSMGFHVQHFTFFSVVRVDMLHIPQSCGICTSSKHRKFAAVRVTHFTEESLRLRFESLGSHGHR
jgi:hypothetical protein